MASANEGILLSQGNKLLIATWREVVIYVWGVSFCGVIEGNKCIRGSIQNWRFCPCFRGSTMLFLEGALHA